MAKHALLSVSSAHRWLHCPPSARLSEKYDDKGSDYAAEGTDAHSLCEYKLRKALGMEATDPTEHLSCFNQEMDGCATGYAAYVLELVEASKETCPDPVVLIEQRFDFFRWVEEGFGTADYIVISDRILQIVDYKHGMDIMVSTEENPQMMCYGLGALEIFDCLRFISTFLCGLALAMSAVMIFAAPFAIRIFLQDDALVGIAATMLRVQMLGIRKTTGTTAWRSV